MDSKFEKSKAFEISYDGHFVNSNQFHMALGNSCYDIMKYASDQIGFDSHNKSSKSKFPSLSKSYFRGRVSLPFFFKGLAQFNDLISKPDNNDIIKCFRE